MDSEITRQLATGDHISAERLILKRLAQNPADFRAMYLHGNILRISGRTREAVGILERAAALAPDSAEILLGLAQAQRDLKQDQAAAASYVKHSACDGVDRLASLENAAACLFRAGDRAHSARILIDAGLLPEGTALDAEAILLAQRTQRLDVDQAVILLRTLAKAEERTAATLMGLAIWESGDENSRRRIVHDLPGQLLAIGRVDDALRIYQAAVEQGLAVGDFRPKSTQSSLASTNAPAAAALYARDRNLFNTSLSRSTSQKSRAWTPIIGADGSVDLRGASAAGVNAVSFELSTTAQNTKTPPRKIDGHLVSANDVQTYWHARIYDLLPGQDYAVRLISDHGDPSSPTLLLFPAAEPEAVATMTADNIGCDGAVFTGRAAPLAAGARYRFAYGTQALDRTTDWIAYPPPKAARSYQRIYRHRGDWLPTCANPSWVNVAGGTLPPDSPALSIGAPFAKDRNQLSGIGAHEMLVGLCWSPSLDPSNPGRIALAIGGGVQDLRDADISFTVGGHQLQQYGAALHFWISHIHQSEQGLADCQWALTGSPIPDEALAGGELQKVTLRLRNDPQDWTYTGNNPREQGERASRYRRVSLDSSLSAHNTATVFIHAFGEVTRPPTGAVLFQDAEIFYRDYSLLSRAAGADLIEFPAGSPDDPLVLTSGSRGYDDLLWTSGAAPSFPLEFKWKLRQPVTLTLLQINQHPYWPAQNVEVLIEDDENQERRIWSGRLPQGRPDRDESPFILESLVCGASAVFVTLRILSGYYPEHCGLDGVEIYGEGALFEPDGQACSLSAETCGLPPGATVNYRIELQDGDDLILGDIRTLVLPADSAPLLHAAIPLKRPHDPACYVIRANAMGLETELWGELQLPDGTLFTGAKISLGSQPTGRHIYYMPAGFPNSQGVFHIRARNLKGDTSLQAPWPCR